MCRAHPARGARFGLISLKALGKAGDQTANQFLSTPCASSGPTTACCPKRKGQCRASGKSRVWIIDPVDGTREYGEARADWAVHVALAIDGVPEIGAVALPGLGVVLRTDAPALCPPPATAHGRQPHPARRRSGGVAEKLGAELVPMGSAGAKAMAVVRGEADIYLHSGGQYEWDSCAPVAVAPRTACMSAASMAARWSITRRTSTCPIC
jgi:3'(2'), 5'-bisphosphate nucleotidase